MKIIVQDKWCVVQQASMEEIRRLATTLTFIDEDDEPADVSEVDLDKLNELWQDKLNSYTFLQRKGEGFRFLSGLLPYFKEHYKGPIEIEDRRTWEPYKVSVPEDYLDGLILREYQRHAAEKALRLRQGILDIPTRGGKTEVMIAIAKYYLEFINPEGKVIFLEPDRKLLYQTEKRCKMRGLTDVGKMGDGHKEASRQVVICIVDTLYNVLSNPSHESYQELSKATALLIDEVHHLGSFTMSYVPIVLDKLEVLLGVSGSPFSDRAEPHSNPEDVTIIGLLHRVILKISSRYLIDRGYIAEPHVFILGYGGPYPRHFIQSWNRVYSKFILWNTNRNAMIREATELFVENRMNTLVLVTRISHGKHLLERFRSFSPDTVFAFGDGRLIRDYDGVTIPEDLPEGWTWYSDKEDAKRGQKFFAMPGGQEQALQDHFDRETPSRGKLVIASTIFDEGVDLPRIDAVIVAGGQGRSDIKNTQRPARALTANDYGNKVAVVDFWDDRHKYTKKHSKLRIEAYRYNQYFIHTGGIEELRTWVREVRRVREEVYGQ